MRLALLVLTTAAVLTRADRAEACMCCDAMFSRVPVGWSADGALLLRRADNLGCMFTAALEVWRIDTDEPERCYDLRGNPETEIACTEVASQSSGKPAAIPSAVASRFAKRPTSLASSRFRVTQRRADPDASNGDLEVVIDLKTRTGWTRGWRGVVRVAASSKVTVTAWPNPKGDRVLLLVSYEEDGSRNQRVDAHWAPLPKR